jgi:membrane protein implicated in regulation of membrane protease activity
VCGFIAGRALPDGDAAWLLAAAALLALAGVFLHPVLSLRVALLPFLTLLAAAGLGSGVPTTVAVALAGAVVVELLHSRLRDNAGQRRRLQQDGVVTTGTVASARRYYVGAIPMTRVAVHYVDDDGRQWQGRADADGIVDEGARVRLRYLPEHPATIEVLRS